MEKKCKKSISVIIPCYNEETYVYKQMKYFITCISEQFETYEIILVDDGSTDQTGLELKRLQKEFPQLVVLENNINLNMGISVQRGMAVAKNEYITFNAVDLPLNPKRLKNLIEKMGTADVLVIQRKKYLGTTVWRRITSLLNRGMMLVLFPLAKSGIKDTNYIQIYKKENIRQLLPLSRSPIFTWPEMIFRARYSGLHVRVVTTEYKPGVVRQGAFGKPNDIIWGIYDMMRFRIKWLKGKEP